MTDKTEKVEVSPEVKPLKEEKVRIYYVDWIRTVSIYFVVYVHCINIAKEMNADRGDTEYQIEITEKSDGIIRTMVQIGIPAFFYISGIATTFYDADKKGFCPYIKGKFLRLVIPFIFAVIVFLIPRLYFTQDFSPMAKLDESQPEILEWNYFTYFGKMLPQFLFKMSWLWFLPALFIDSLINYPILKWTQRRYSEKPMSLKDDGLIFGGLFLTLFIWIAFQWTLVGSKVENGRRDVFLMTMVVVIVYAAYFILPGFIVKRENGYKYSWWLKMIGPIAMILMNIVKNGSEQD